MCASSQQLLTKRIKIMAKNNAIEDAQELRLSTLHPDLQKLYSAVMADLLPIAGAGLPKRAMPYLVSGHRTKSQQDDAVSRKASSVMWPMSAHNALPSLAMDVQGIDPTTNKLLDNDDAVLWCCAYAVLIFKKASEMGIKLKWGGTWDVALHGNAMTLFAEVARRNRLRARGVSRLPDNDAWAPRQTTWCDCPHWELYALYDAYKTKARKGKQ